MSSERDRSREQIKAIWDDPSLKAQADELRQKHSARHRDTPDTSFDHQVAKLNPQLSRSRGINPVDLVTGLTEPTQTDSGIWKLILRILGARD